MKRKIIHIHEALCNGCGICVQSCHESAIQMIDGKAKLLDDKYCDGLGDCLPACPTGAIEIIERTAVPYDEDAVIELLQSLGKDIPPSLQQNVNLDTIDASASQSVPNYSGCPGMQAKKLTNNNVNTNYNDDTLSRPSQLRQWPIQLHLINPSADYLVDADLLIAADCTAFSYGDFHKDFMNGKVTIIGCPKLDDNQFYTQKLTHIFTNNSINSITVARMEVPCCSGLVAATKEALSKSGKLIYYNEVVITVDGKIIP
jgi:NAD-dependent dihydropyrimidine dehydrogenase PreA subunit